MAKTKFLKNHCDLAWKIAIANCRLITDGLVDVEQQKIFVSTLQNAIEICYKQVMIDNCDYSVINLSTKKGNDVQLIKNYLNSNDLNDYFRNLDEKLLKECHTADFNEIIDSLAKDVKSLLGKDIINELCLLKGLRNNATHFYIDLNEFINFDQFHNLCYLIDTLYTYFKEKDIIGSTFGDIQEDHVDSLLYFDIDAISFHSYNRFVKTSETNKDIWMQFNPVDHSDDSVGHHCSMRNIDDIFGIAYEVFNDQEAGVDITIKLSFSEFYRRFKLLVDNGIITLHEYIEEDVIRDDDGGFISAPYGSIVINRKKETI